MLHEQIITTEGNIQSEDITTGDEKVLYWTRNYSTPHSLPYFLMAFNW